MMHEDSLKLENVIKDLSYNSGLILQYLVSNGHVELLTVKMVSRILKKIYKVEIETIESERILYELSEKKNSLLVVGLTFMDKELDYSDYLELGEEKKSLVSCYYYPTKKMKKIIKNAN